jgi:FkbM family methyltransferase
MTTWIGEKFNWEHVNMSSKVARFLGLAWMKARLVVLRATKRNPNDHLSGDCARLSKIPFTNKRVFIRPAVSDLKRISEYVSGIYFNKNYLHDAVLKSKPSLLIDIGGNIGLSSLSLLSEFPTLKKIVAIEAEYENWKVLKRNFDLWSLNFPNVEFIAIHGIASSRANAAFAVSKLSDSPDITASGTFKFTPQKSVETEVSNSTSVKSVTINSLLEIHKSPNSGSVICKIDIEGGEQFLLSENTEWLSRISFLTIEVHDKYDEELINSSTALCNAIVEHNFSIMPEKDILHCYSRKLFSTMPN